MPMLHKMNPCATPERPPVMTTSADYYFGSYSHCGTSHSLMYNKQNPRDTDIKLSYSSSGKHSNISRTKHYKKRWNWQNTILNVMILVFCIFFLFGFATFPLLQTWIHDFDLNHYIVCSFSCYRRDVSQHFILKRLIETKQNKLHKASVEDPKLFLPKAQIFRI